MPRHNMVMKGQWNARWPNGDMPRSSQGIPLRACGARPSEGGLTGGHGPCGESPEMAPRTDFLRGTRSARPQRRAGRKPRHVTPRDRYTGSFWPNDEMRGSSASLHCGRAEPAPPRGGRSKARWPREAKPGRGREGRSYRTAPMQMWGQVTINRGIRTAGDSMKWCLPGLNAIFGKVSDPALSYGKPMPYFSPSGSHPDMSHGKIFVQSCMAWRA